MGPPKYDHCRPRKPTCRPLPKVPPSVDESIDPDRGRRGVHGLTEVFFEPPSPPKTVDTRPLRERCINKRVMDLQQTGGVVRIRGGKLQFGRHREGHLCPGKIAQDKGDLEWANKHAQTSLPSTGNSEDLFPEGGPVALAAPEFHTTLRLAGRLRALEAHQPDLSRLVERRLQNCPCAAERVRAQAHSRLNYGFTEHQYGNLVPVEVEESILIREIEAEKQAVVEAYRPVLNGRPAGPHLHDLMHLAVQHEFPVPPDPASLQGRPPPPPQPLGYDDLALRASRRHQSIFSGRCHH